MKKLQEIAEGADEPEAHMPLAERWGVYGIIGEDHTEHHAETGGVQPEAARLFFRVAAAPVTKPAHQQEVERAASAPQLQEQRGLPAQIRQVRL